MRLTPTERDRLLLFGAAELARARRARGLRLNVPEATALIADTVCEAARDGRRLAEAIEAARRVLGPDDVLPGVADVVTEVHVEAVFDDGSRLAVVSRPLGEGLGDEAPGAVVPGPATPGPEPVLRLTVHNTATVPVSVTSHFHFFEANPRLDFDRAAAYGMRLCVPAGSSARFGPGSRPRWASCPSAATASRSGSPGWSTDRSTPPAHARRRCGARRPADTWERHDEHRSARVRLRARPARRRPGQAR